MRPLRRSLLTGLFFIGAAAFAQTEARHADHEELRAMLRTATDALNRRDFAVLAPLFSEHCDITTVDGRSFTTLAAFKSYVDSIYASRVSKIEFHPVADALTTFLDNDSGVSTGSSTDTYTFKDGDSRTMTSRWTATLHREGGRWKVAALHMSANVLDNPVIEATRKTAHMLIAAGVLLGLIAGYVIRMAVKRS
jgi:uncharacterized protein (TIGR02246 family)